MKSWLYARVSTAKNDCRSCGKAFLSAEAQPVCPVCASTDIQKSQDTENQLRILRLWMRELGHEVEREYVDRASGGKSDRARFTAMYVDLAARKNRYPVLIGFWSLDRLSREGVLETLQHLRRMTDLGAEWKSYTEQYLDSTGILKDAIIGIFAALAAQQRVRIADNTRAGLERAKVMGTRSGKAIGRPALLDREEVLRLYAQSKSIRTTARALGVSYSAVRFVISGRSGKKPKPMSWSQPVWGVVENNLFVERDGGEVVVRFDMETGLPWCLNHQGLFSRCVGRHTSNGGQQDETTATVVAI